MWRALVLLLCLRAHCLYLHLPEGSECSQDGVKGRCVSVHRCLGAVMAIKNKKYPPVCTYEGHTPIICCTDCDLVPDTRLLLFNKNLGILTKTGTIKAKDKCLDYLHTLGYPCKRVGFASFPGILNKEKNCIEQKTINWRYAAAGGRDALREEFPHMALLGYGASVDTADWLCGGSVISERFVLTAAHCASTPTLGPVKYVAVGILKRSDPEKLWQRNNVKRFIAHPQYQAPSKYHDIALIETYTEFSFESNVLPACLHVDDNVDDSAVATGWGALGYRQGVADNLQSVLISRYSEEECALKYPPHRHLKLGYNTTTQMCYGDRGDQPRDTCQGDSGGPLQSATHEMCVRTIIGVTSYGRRCDETPSAGMYTRVAPYVPWIEDIVWP